MSGRPKQKRPLFRGDLRGLCLLPRICCLVSAAWYLLPGNTRALTICAIRSSEGITNRDSLGSRSNGLEPASRYRKFSFGGRHPASSETHAIDDLKAAVSIHFS
jgi:hypothetical protein